MNELSGFDFYGPSVFRSWTEKEVDYFNEKRVLKSIEIYDHKVDTSEYIIPFADWNRVTVLLAEGRKIENLFLFKNKYLFHCETWAAKGFVARDAISDFVFVLGSSPFMVFNFTQNDIQNILTTNTERFFFDIFSRSPRMICENMLPKVGNCK